MSIVKNSGSFAALTLLVGLLAATSVSLIRRSCTAAAQAAAPAAQKAQPAVMTNPAAEKKGAQCVEVAQARRAHQRVAAYELISHEGPVADAGDDAGLLQQVPPPQQPPDSTPPRCTDPQIL